MPRILSRRGGVIARPRPAIPTGGGGGLTDDGSYIYTHETVDSGTVLAEDFSDGVWYDEGDDPAGNRGWNGTIFADDMLVQRPNATVSLGSGNYVGTSGNRSGDSRGGNMADHALKRACTDLWVRLYVKALSGYSFGAEKRLTFNDGAVGGHGIKFGNFSWQCASSANSTGALTMGFPVAAAPPEEDVCNSQSFALSSGTWYCIINHMKLNTLSGTANGEFRSWVDGCGTGTIPVNPGGSPTLRFTRTNVNYNRLTTDEKIRVLWFESWSNPGSNGECYIGWIHANDAASPGFCSLLN